jgi:hypothetical protein
MRYMSGSIHPPKYYLALTIGISSYLHTARNVCLCHLLNTALGMSYAAYAYLLIYCACLHPAPGSRDLTSSVEASPGIACRGRARGPESTLAQL